MSEYQYYEFLAIDRPLTEAETGELRRLSTRAHITPVSFTNEYHWGSFKGDPHFLMERYFDAHVYVANWMTAVFMVRLPIEALTETTAKAVVVPDILDIERTKTHWVITWQLDESENYDRFGMEDGRGWMASLVPVRDELLRGDLRSLYIGWLAAVTGERVDDDAMEPLAVTGLGDLTTAQRALAEFLEVDPDLLAGAGMGSPAAQNGEIHPKEMEKWIDDLSRDEVAVVLKQLLEGKGRQTERSVMNRFEAWRRGRRGAETKVSRRSVEELWKNAGKARQVRLERLDQARKQQEVARRKEREAYLTNLARDLPRAWNSVRRGVERGSGLAYDEACRALVDLSEAYALQSNQKGFQQDLHNFMQDHLRRRALIKRLVEAGIWKDE